MSDCCTPESTRPPEAGSELCPGCGAKGSRVDPITLKALLTGEGLRQGVPLEPRFCATPSCPLVYFDNAAGVRFEENVVSLPVHAKHPGDEDVPVCYCFGHTPGSMRAELGMKGRSTASQTIAADVKAGLCACEVKSPKGTCCLGDVSKIERLLAASASASLR